MRTLIALLLMAGVAWGGCPDGEDCLSADYDLTTLSPTQNTLSEADNAPSWESYINDDGWFCQDMGEGYETCFKHPFAYQQLIEARYSMMHPQYGVVTIRDDLSAEVRDILERCREFIRDGDKDLSITETSDLLYRATTLKSMAEGELAAAKRYVERLERETQLRRDIERVLGE